MGLSSGAQSESTPLEQPTSRLWNPRPQGVLHSDQGPELQVQGSELRHGLDCTGPAPWQAPLTKQVTSRVSTPAPQGALQADQSPTDHWQPSMLLHSLAFSGSAPSQIAPLGHDTDRVSSPRLQAAWQPDHEDTIQAHTCNGAKQSSKASGWAREAQPRSPRSEGQVTSLKRCPRPPHTTTEQLLQLPTSQPQRPASAPSHGCLSNGLCNCAQSVLSPEVHCTSRAREPGPQGSLQLDHSPTVHEHADVSWQGWTAGGGTARQSEVLPEEHCTGRLWTPLPQKELHKDQLPETQAQPSVPRHSAESVGFSAAQSEGFWPEQVTLRLRSPTPHTLEQ